MNAWVEEVLYREGSPLSTQIIAWKGFIGQNQNLYVEYGHKLGASALR